MLLRMTFMKMKNMKTVLGIVMLMAGLCVMAGPVPPATVTVTNPASVFILPAGLQTWSGSVFPIVNPAVSDGAAVPNVKSPELNLDMLVMQGISGLPPHQLVIINKHTFAVGDEGEVSTSQGRIHVHCLEINAHSAVIEVNGQRHELRYQDKQ